MSIAKEATCLLTQIQTKIIPWTYGYDMGKLTGRTAIVTGAFIVTAVGFAGPEVLHNAAHDIRHGLAFPCH